MNLFFRLLACYGAITPTICGAKLQKNSDICKFLIKIIKYCAKILLYEKIFVSLHANLPNYGQIGSFLLCFMQPKD